MAVASGSEKSWSSAWSTSSSWRSRAGLDLSDARVVVVDDVDANVRLLERMLSSEGITDVHRFTDPRLAVGSCLELDPDLVLLDLHMPDMDGLAVLNALRTRLPRDAFLPVVMLTADATAAARERALEAGASDFVTKPFDRIEVLLRVRNLLETRGLYTRVQHHKERLQARLDAHLARERHIALEHRRKSDRIRQILRGDALNMVFQPIVEHRGVLRHPECLS